MVLAITWYQVPLGRYHYLRRQNDEFIIYDVIDIRAAVMRRKTKATPLTEPEVTNFVTKLILELKK